MPSDQPPDQPGPPAPGRPVPGRPGPARPVGGRPYRTPRYTVFLGTGAVLGLVAGLALALYGSGDTVTTEAGVLGYFSAFGVIIGTLLGGTLAVLVESLMNRASRRRTR